MKRKNFEKTKKPIGNIILLILIAVTTAAVMIMGFIVGGKTQNPIEEFMKFIRSGGSADSAYDEPTDTEYIQVFHLIMMLFLHLLLKRTKL